MAESTDWIELKRDCEAVQVPAGHVMLLPKGTRAVITQALGGSYTLHIQGYGGLVRVAAKDADALGEEVPEEARQAATEGAGEAVDRETLEALVWQQLKTCYDPEIPVNIVDLGLVYDMQIAPLDGGQHRVDVKMTLTAQGCGMGGSIAADAKYKLMTLPGIGDANVEIVWSPIWNPNMISPEGRARLGME